VLLSTLIVAISPFIYFFLTKGGGDEFEWGQCYFVGHVIGILLAGFVAPFLFVGKSSFLVTVTFIYVVCVAAFIRLYRNY